MGIKAFSREAGEARASAWAKEKDAILIAEARARIDKGQDPFGTTNEVTGSAQKDTRNEIERTL